MDSLFLGLQPRHRRSRLEGTGDPRRHDKQQLALALGALVTREEPTEQRDLSENGNLPLDAVLLFQNEAADEQHLAVPQLDGGLGAARAQGRDAETAQLNAAVEVE